jgi:acetyl-CoA carboxylase biotin carboxyl carrier protein
MANKAKEGQRPPQPGAAGNRVDLPEVERVLEFMQRHGLEEFEYERDGLRIRLKKPSAVYAQPVLHAAAAPAIGAQPGAPVAEVPRGTAAGAPPQGAVESADLHIVKSPIVGTFYSSPSPETPPFVTLGARVDEGQALCIIEAMKLMNEIEADVAGEIVKIFVENGQPVEYGEALFGIHPNRKK